MHSLDVYFTDTEQRVSSVESQALAWMSTNRSDSHI